MIPTLEDLSTLNRVLPRSATGQEIENYFTIVRGPSREGDLRQYRALLVIVVDNGRTRLVGSDMQDMLRCIRCGACMNHCPVFQTVGGHALPQDLPRTNGIGAGPGVRGVENALDLPQAATLCSTCGVACQCDSAAGAAAQAARAADGGGRCAPWRERMGFRLSAFRPPRVRASTRARVPASPCACSG